MDMTDAPELDERESKQRTLDACAWLIPIAEMSVKEFGWDPSIVRWLDRLGDGCHEELQVLLRQ